MFIPAVERLQHRLDTISCLPVVLVYYAENIGCFIEVFKKDLFLLGVMEFIGVGTDHIDTVKDNLSPISRFDIQPCGNFRYQGEPAFDTTCSSTSFLIGGEYLNFRGPADDCPAKDDPFFTGILISLSGNMAPVMRYINSRSFSGESL